MNGGAQYAAPRPFSTMKNKTPEANKLCPSCRRPCKQPATAIVASCPRYYPFPTIKRTVWKQLELKL